MWFLTASGGTRDFVVDIFGRGTERVNNALTFHYLSVDGLKASSKVYC